DAELTDVTISKTDLRKTVFENCIFKGVNFKYADMRNVCLDGQTFINVKFDKTALNDATFNRATLRNVSFRPTYALTNKFYRAIPTISFDGAKMDKLTYAELKGLGAGLSKVTVV
ncbi:MAG TPA: pentapeptide repeat-containing protein, partial [Flavipsychrobacter sp.]